MPVMRDIILTSTRRKYGVEQALEILFQGDNSDREYSSDSTSESESDEESNHSSISTVKSTSNIQSVLGKKRLHHTDHSSPPKLRKVTKNSTNPALCIDKDVTSSKPGVNSPGVVPLKKPTRKSKAVTLSKAGVNSPGVVPPPSQTKPTHKSKAVSKPGVNSPPVVPLKMPTCKSKAVTLSKAGVNSPGIVPRIRKPVSKKKLTLSIDTDLESDENVIPPSPNSNIFRPSFQTSEPVISIPLDAEPVSPAKSPPSSLHRSPIAHDIANLIEMVENSDQDEPVSPTPSPPSSPHILNEENSDLDEPDYYEIEQDVRRPHDEVIPLVNWSKDKVIEEDVINGWVRHEEDIGPGELYAFTGSRRYLFSSPPSTCLDYFHELFDNNMWTILSENTNKKVRQKQSANENANGNNDPVDLIDVGGDLENNPNARINNFVDTTPDEMKVFLAHLIVFGLMKKNSVDQYWTTDNILHIPFFGRYMSRNRFQNILWNLHVSDPDIPNPQVRMQNHDPLHLVRPLVDMMKKTFRTKYRPGKELSVDESTCPFKGRVNFKCFNPKKPNRFHIKLFMVSEAKTGYICGFNVYTGGDEKKPEKNEITTTTKTVLQLLESVGFLNMGHHIYFDNWYNSPELLQQLEKKKTYGCGTVRKRRKGLPKAVSGIKLKKKG